MEASGQYTSILINPVIPVTITVIGQVCLVGDELVFHVSHPPDQPTEHYRYTLSSDRLTLEGDSEFPFYGEPEPVKLTVQLRRRWAFHVEQKENHKYDLLYRQRFCPGNDA